MAKVIKPMNQSLRWLGDILALLSSEAISIPTDYRTQVLQTKKLLESDGSGFVNSLLDFAINCACVDYTIETDNPTLTKLLTDWLHNINFSLRGKIPVGIQGLAKEYFRERWKGSSNLVLRTFWDNSLNNINLPTVGFFVDGEDIKIKTQDKKVLTLGEEQYYIRVDEHDVNDIAIPNKSNELLFVQKPYESWGTLSPIPFLIRRGLFRNMKFMDLMSTKGEYIVGKALEYLFFIKKGTERMALEGKAEMVYSEEDLKKVSDDFKTMLDEKRSTITGTPTFTGNFDTEFQHLIPDYKLAVNDALYGPIERKILAGLGLVDIVTGVSSARRESILNPKPFIAEIRQGVEDFRNIIEDMLQIIIQRNKKDHKKFFSDNITVDVQAGAISAFLDKDIKDHLRSMYDRGTISIQTYNDLVGDGYVYHSVEVARRKQEAEDKLEELMYPHVTQNQESTGLDVPGQEPVEEVEPDKLGPESKNYQNAEIEFEEVSYKTNKDLPIAVKKYPSGAQTAFRKAWITSYSESKNEQTAFNVAWSVLKQWVLKHKGTIDSDLAAIED